MQSEDFKALKERKQEYNKIQLEKFELIVDDLIEGGNEVIRLTPFHYRINGKLDVYPVSSKFHDLEKNKRGFYKSVFTLVSKMNYEQRIRENSLAANINSTGARV